MHSISVAQDNVNLFVSRQMFSDFCMRISPVLPDSQYKLLAQFMLEEVIRTVLYWWYLYVVNKIIYHLVLF